MSSVLEAQGPHVVSTDAAEQVEAFARDVKTGLTQTPKRLSPRFFYDKKGSQLFEAICELPEYYLTRAEFEILRTHAREIAAQCPQKVSLIELGSGSAAKTRLLIEALIARHGALRYVPIDISRPMLEKSAEELVTDYAGLEIHTIAGEYQEGIRHLNEETAEVNLILFLGSNIGNLEPDEATAFLKSIRQAMRAQDRLLVGIDLRKDRHTLERAYDDEAGVTALFNLNILKRINQELGGEFDLTTFAHRACFNDAHGRVELHLVSLRKQTVWIADVDLAAVFDRNETIHTENSYKYTLPQIHALAEKASLTVDRQWFDRRRRFTLNRFAPA